MFDYAQRKLKDLKGIELTVNGFDRIEILPVPKECSSDTAK